MHINVKKLGILGGGQLGRMSALAAAKLGIQTHIYEPGGPLCPAAQVSAKETNAPYDNQEALKKFAESVDVISYEFENIPSKTIRYLKKLKPVYPDDALLEISQHRVNEKQCASDHGIQTTRWEAVQSAEDIKETFEKWKTEGAILKTCRFGYDGKGQTRVSKYDDLDQKIGSLKSDDLILEEIVDFTCEISVIVVRNKAGEIKTYDPALNEHKNHILHRSIVPATVSPDILEKSVQTAIKMAEALNLVGVMGVEMFVTKTGDVLLNEIAPRTHNSGHWTIDACACSQFENHVRAVCGLPLGSTERHSDAEMLNLIGNDINTVDQYLKQSNACIHLYGKAEARPGRKMGHINILKPKT